MAYPVYEDNGGMATGQDYAASASYPGTVNADDILIAVATDEDNDSFSTPSGWTVVDSLSHSNFSVYVFYKRAVGTESGSETFTSASNAGSLVTASIFRFSGCVSSGTPYEAGANWGIQSSLTATISDITTSGNDRLAISFACQEDNTTHSGTSTYTSAADLSTDVGNDARVTLYTYQKATAGAVGSDTVTNGGVADYVCTFTMALKPVSGTDVDATLGTVTVAGYAAVVGVGGAFYLFDDYVDHLGEEIHNFSTDTIKVGLVTSTAAPTQGSVAAWGTFSPNEVSGTGYTPGGNALAGTSWNEAGGTATFDANDLTFSYNAAGPTNARYAIIYNDSDVTTPKAAIGFLDLGGTRSLQNAGLKLQWAGTGIHRIM